MRLSLFVLLMLLVSMLPACGESSTEQADLPKGQAPAAAPEPAEPTTDAVTPDEADTSPEAEEPQQQPEPTPAPPASIAADAERVQGPGFSYVMPEGWTVGPAKQMRILTLIAPDELGGGELAVGRWPSGVGSYHDNVVRWAQQVGLTPADAAKLDGLDLVDVDGVQSRWQALFNPQADQALLTVWVPRTDDEILTIKYPAVPGPVGAIEAASPAVRGFVESIEFD